MTNQQLLDDKFPGFIVTPSGDGIDDAGEREIPEFIRKDNVGWRKVADIRDGWQRFAQAVRDTVERL